MLAAVKAEQKAESGPQAAGISRSALWYQVVLISPKGVAALLAALQPSGLIQQVTFICDRSVLPAKLQRGVIWPKYLDFISDAWCEVFTFGKP